jgi:uncharacterized protein (UPF0262 family)
MEQDCVTALNDLTHESYFKHISDNNGPYDLTLSIEINKLIFHIKNAKGKELPLLILSLSPYRSIIKDYYLMVHAHHEAVLEGRPSHIEAIDMGRRSLHNEGAELLIERLSDKIEMDINTARRLFTLICALHRDKIRIMR